VSILAETHCRTEHNIVHVYPDADSVDHDLRGFRCVCGPRVEYVEGGWVVCHEMLGRVA
jgi:hypothetical protein